jgi:glycine betaine/proline transport system ATP-binding protein
MTSESVEGITKVFGPDPDSILPLLRQGKSKSEIQAETGHVVGVHDASFSIRPNQIFAIMGLSGSGKSTMIRCVNRLIEPTAGRILLDDPESGERAIIAMRAAELRMLRRRDISMVFQHFALFPHRTVLSNVVYGLEIQGRDQSERAEVGQKVLDMVGLGEWGDAYPAELSGGMQQRVGLARALATDARILLMDEPFSALDPLIRVQMQQELKKLQSDLGRTILFITHDLDEAMHIGDRIAIMEGGEIVQIGTPEEILVNPRTEYVARFVEQADPTGVITAGTIALPLDSAHFEHLREANGVSYFARPGYQEMQFGIDAEGHLREVLDEDRAVETRPLAEALEQSLTAPPGRPRSDLVLTCAEDAVLRELLRGRVCSTLPTVVTDGAGRVKGIVDETELISGILEKRGEVSEGSDSSKPQHAAET